MKSYVVDLTGKYGEIILSREYRTFEEAVKFIESRPDKPQRVGETWEWRVDGKNRSYWVIENFTSFVEIKR